MEFVLLALLVLFIVFAPIIFSIVAVVKVHNLRAEVEELRYRLGRQAREAAEARIEPLLATPEPEQTPEPVKEEEVIPAPVRSEPILQEPVSVEPEHIEEPEPATPPPPVPPSVPAKPKAGFEFMMGGRAAAFAGIAILVIGIAFLVAYAIQKAWLGPGARVILGLISGLVLVGIGHWVGRLHEKYTVFSRVLTGGGSSLFYFIVFMAYAHYSLIGAVAAGVGLFVCAAAVFGLAMLYRSQAVAVLGVLGAFITPILVGGELDAGVFPLVYIALINVPVILLGVRRKWQTLYNLAFVFTIIHFLLWMDRLGSGDFIPGLCFAVVLYLQYAFLGLLKLRHEQHTFGRSTDLIRLALASLLLLGAVYLLFEETGHGDWTALAFVVLALMQFGIAAAAYKLLTRFSGEITAFVAGGLFAIAMALPVHFDGEWVSLGWGIEGAILAGFALRVRSRVLQSGAFALAVGGLFKLLVYDYSFFDQTSDQFMAAHFSVCLISAALVGLQGVIARLNTEDELADQWREVTWSVGAIAIAITTVQHFDGEWVSLGWSMEGLVLAWLAIRVRLRTLQGGAFMLGIAGLIKVLTYDATLYSEPPNLFLNLRFAVGIVSVVLLALQGRMAAKAPEDEMVSGWSDVAWWICGAAAVLFSCSDVFWTLGFDEAYSWLMTSLILLGAGAALILLPPKNATVSKLGCLILLAVPVKLLLVDAVIAYEENGFDLNPFANTIIWLQLVMLVIMVLLIQPRLAARERGLLTSPSAMACLINLTALASGLGLLTMELKRLETDWGNMAITILWAASALALILFGMKRKSAAHRYFGLVLIGLATLKVIFFDSSGLDDLQRIGAFIGTGVLLLILSFAYQKASAYFQALEE